MRRIDGERNDRHAEQNDLIRGPRWRVEASPAKRRRAAAATVAIGVAIGVVVLWFAMWLLGELGAPGWLVLAPWWSPTIVMVALTLVRPRPARVEDDDQAWVTYSVKYALFGSEQPHQTPVRIIAAVLLGAPLAWAISAFWLLALVGLADI